MIEVGDELVEYVRAAFGLAVDGPATITLAARGAVGQIWRLAWGEQRYALKELLHREFDEAELAREAAGTAHFAAAGILLPVSVPATDGRFVVPVPRELGGGAVRLNRWVAGAPVRTSADTTELAEPLGELLGRLHRYAPPAVGAVDPWYESTPDAASWDALTSTALADGTDWAPTLVARRGLIDELTGLVTATPTDRLLTCHRDLHPDNALVSPSGELIALDWDDIGPADPDRELAITVVRWHVWSGVADLDAIRRSLLAYRAAGGTGWLRDDASFGMSLSCDLNFLCSQARRALDPATAPEHREFAAKEVREMLAHLTPPALLARLLEVAAAAG